MPQSTDCTASILGIRVGCLTFEQAQDLLERMVGERSGGYFSNANAYSVTLAHADPDLREILERASYVMADGMSVVFGLRLLGRQCERVHGDDFFLSCCRRFPHWRHFLVGGRIGQPELVTAELARRFPGIVVAGFRPTPVRPIPAAELPALIQEIRAADPDVVWVGMGTPEQDRFMASCAAELGRPMIGVGSVFDLLAGRTRPAPEWIKQAGMQWLFRLLQEPQRLLTRYLKHNSQFVVLFVAQLVWTRCTEHRRTSREPARRNWE